MTKPTMDTVQSSNITAIGFDAEDGILHVEFKGGAVYIHDDVSPDLYEEFKATESKGSFYNQRIKNQFKFRKE